MTFRTVRAIGLRLPDTEEGTAYGSPALKVQGKMFACMANHKSAEPNTLALLLDFAQRDELIAEDPQTYYLKEHYVNYPCVLVRLSRIHPDALRDLLGAAWRFVNSSNRRKTKRSMRSWRRHARPSAPPHRR
jgi:hypothetical protein